MAYGTALHEGLGRHHEPRHQPRRPGAEARADRRAQPRRRERRGHRARHRAAHALPGAQQPVAGRHHRAARARRPRQRRDPLLRRRRPRHRRRRRSARSSGCSTARTSAARSRGDIGDIVFPPRSLEFYTAALERGVDIDRLRERAFKVVLDYSFGAASIVMPTRAREARRRGARGQPVREHGVGHVDRRDPRRAGRADRRARPRRRGATSASSSTPTARSATVVDDGGHVLEPERAAARARGAGRGGACPARASRCRCQSPSEAERIADGARRARSCWTKLRRRQPHGGRRERRTSTFAGIARRRLHLARLPARLRRRRRRW